MRSTLALLLLFGAVIGHPTCNKLYELPETGYCERTIKWKVHDNDQALATCLEYFPTTFVKGERDQYTGLANCIVKAAYQCIEKDAFVMFDKCYKFPKDSLTGKYKTGKMSDYVKSDGSEGICEKGKLSVFYSSDHAKFVGMKAHKLGIDKLWIGITADGKTIEEPHMKIHSKLWNLVEDDYWQNGKLQKGKPADGVANYFFMRTDTDYVLGRWQGKFEQTDGETLAAFACEYESKVLADQEWYCEKLPMLGIPAVYAKKPDDERCLYISSSKVTFDGNFKTMEQMSVCKEKPSDLHSAGMDDGTGQYDAYPTLAKTIKGLSLLRIGGVIVETMINSAELNEVYVQHKCQGVVTDRNRKKKLREKWNYIDHYGTTQRAAACGIYWRDEYPLKECSDFPGDSTTVGMRDGLLVDMPPQVRAQAVCSIKVFQECGEKKPCHGMQECTNMNGFQTKTYSKKPGHEVGFFTCGCPGNVRGADGQLTTKIHEEADDGSCTWLDENKHKCAYLDFNGYTGWLPKGAPYDWETHDFIEPGYYNDLLTRMVVRSGCEVNIKAHVKKPAKEHLPNFILVSAKYGTSQVPNTRKGTMPGYNSIYDASLGECWCPF